MRCAGREASASPCDPSRTSINSVHDFVQKGSLASVRTEPLWAVLAQRSFEVGALSLCASPRPRPGDDLAAPIGQAVRAVPEGHARSLIRGSRSVDSSTVRAFQQGSACRSALSLTVVGRDPDGPSALLWRGRATAYVRSKSAVAPDTLGRSVGQTARRASHTQSQGPSGGLG